MDGILMSKNNLSRLGKHRDVSLIGEQGGAIDHFDAANAKRYIDDTEQSVWGMSGYHDLTQHFRPIRGKTNANSTGNDYAYDYDTTDIHFDIGAAASTTKRIYISHKYTISGSSTSAWADDQCIACVQVFNDDDELVHAIGATEQGNNTNTIMWQTTTTDQTSYKTPQQAAALTFTNCFVSSNAVDRFNVSRTTASSYTGMLGGIPSSYYYSTANPPVYGKLPLGLDSVENNGSSFTGTYYIYHEASGFSHNQRGFARTVDALTMPQRGYIRVAYKLTTRNQSLNQYHFDPDDSIAIAMY